jgi:enamine deaminase RidA (YjgF/YER057c/UK114 family)
MSEINNAGSVLQMDTEHLMRLHMDFFDWLNDKYPSRELSAYLVIRNLRWYCENQGLSITDTVALTHLITVGVERHLPIS